MDWTGGSNLRPSFVSRPADSLNFLYNYNNFDPFPAGMEMMNKHTGGAVSDLMAPVPQYVMGPSSSVLDHKNFMNNQEKKKRLTNDQLESLENSFLEEIKLDPDRKMKLARELGLQPRQVAVWFQNRRARWKAKQLERLYDSLKQEFDAVSREKQKLQEEVLKLKAMVMEQAARNQVSTGYMTEISAEETVESTSVPLNCSGGKQPQDASPPPPQLGGAAPECHYLFNVDEYNTAVSPPYWGALPSYP